MANEDQQLTPGFSEILVAFVEGKYKLLTGLCLANIMRIFKSQGESFDCYNSQSTNCLLCMEMRALLEKSWKEYCEIETNELLVSKKHQFDYPWKSIKNIWSFDLQSSNPRNETSASILSTLGKNDLSKLQFQSEEFLCHVKSCSTDVVSWKDFYTFAAESLLQYCDESSAEVNDNQVDFLDSSFSFRVSTDLSSVQIRMQSFITELPTTQGNNQQVSFEVCSDCLSRVLYDLNWSESNRQRCVSDLINHMIAMLYVSINDLSEMSNEASSSTEGSVQNEGTNIEVILDDDSLSNADVGKNPEKSAKICTVGPPITVALTPMAYDKPLIVTNPDPYRKARKNCIKNDVFDVLQGSEIKQYCVISTALKSHSSAQSNILLRTYKPNASKPSIKMPMKLKGPGHVFIPHNVKLLNNSTLNSKPKGLAVYKPLKIYKPPEMKVIKLKNMTIKPMPLVCPGKKNTEEVTMSNLISPVKEKTAPKQSKVARKRSRVSVEPEQDSSMKGVVEDFLKTFKENAETEEAVKPVKRRRKTFKTMPIPYECHYLCIDQTLARKGWKAYWFRRCKCAKPNYAKKPTPKKETPKFAARKYKKSKVDSDSLSVGLPASNNDIIEDTTSTIADIKTDNGEANNCEEKSNGKGYLALNFGFEMKESNLNEFPYGENSDTVFENTPDKTTNPITDGSMVSHIEEEGMKCENNVKETIIDFDITSHDHFSPVKEGSKEIVEKENDRGNELAEKILEKDVIETTPPNGFHVNKTWNVSIKNQSPILFSEVTFQNVENTSSKNNTLKNNLKSTISPLELEMRKQKVEKVLKLSLSEQKNPLKGSTRPFVFAQYSNLVDRHTSELVITDFHPFWLKQLPKLTQEVIEKRKNNKERTEILLQSKSHSPVVETGIDPQLDVDLKSIWNYGKSREFFKKQKKMEVCKKRNFKPRLVSTSRKVLSKARLKMLTKLCKHLPKEIPQKEVKKSTTFELTPQIPSTNNEMFSDTLWGVASYGKSDILSNLQHSWGYVDCDLISQPYGAVTITEEQITKALDALKQSNDICTFSSKRIDQCGKKNVLIIKRKYICKDSKTSTVAELVDPGLNEPTTDISPSKILLKIKKTYNRDKPNDVIYTHSNHSVDVLWPEGFEGTGENEMKVSTHETEFESSLQSETRNENNTSHQVGDDKENSNHSNNVSMHGLIDENDLQDLKLQHESSLHEILSISDINSFPIFRQFLYQHKKKDTSPSKFLSHLKSTQKSIQKHPLDANDKQGLHSGTLTDSLNYLPQSPEIERGHSPDSFQLINSPMTPPDINKSDSQDVKFGLEDDKLLCRVDNMLAVKACDVLETIDGLFESMQNKSEDINEMTLASNGKVLSIKKHALNGVYWNSLTSPQNKMEIIKDEVKKTQWFLRDRSKPKVVEIKDVDDTSSDGLIDVCGFDEIDSLEEYIRPPRKCVGPIHYRQNCDDIIEGLTKLQEQMKDSPPMIRCGHFESLSVKEVNIRSVKRWLLETTQINPRLFLLRQHSNVKQSKKVKSRKQKWVSRRYDDEASTTLSVPCLQNDNDSKRRSSLQRDQETSPYKHTEFSEQDFEDLRQFLFKARHPTYNGPLTNNVPSKPTFSTDIVYPPPLSLTRVDEDTITGSETSFLVPCAAAKRERRKRGKKKELLDFELVTPPKRRRSLNGVKNVNGATKETIKAVNEPENDPTTSSNYFPRVNIENIESNFSTTDIFHNTDPETSDKITRTRSGRGIGRSYYVSGRARFKARYLNTHCTTGSYIKRILDSGTFTEL